MTPSTSSLTATAKLSELFSGISLDRLLETLLETVIERADAGKAAFVLPYAAELFVAAVATGSQPADRQWVPLANSQDLAIALIQSVAQSLQPALTHQPQTACCLPIQSAGALIGILYLEPGLGTVSSDQLETLNLFCTQTANFWANAALYHSLQQSAAAERQRAEELERSLQTLHRNTAILEAQREASLDGILFVDENQHVVFYNQQFRDIWQVPQTLLQSGDDRLVLKHAVSQTQHPENFLALVEYLYQHPEAVSFDEFRLKQGQTLERRSVAVRSPAGEYYGRIWYFRDITKRKTAEAELRQKEAQYRSIFETTLDGIMITDLETLLAVAVNPAMCQMHGYTLEEFLVLPPDQMVHPNSHHLFAQYVKVVSDGEQFACEAIDIHKDGSLIDIEVRGMPITYNGRACALAIVRDVSDRKQAEQAVQQKTQELEQALHDLQQTQLQMIQSEKMSTLGNLVSGIAHEINNPVGFLAGNIQPALAYIKDLFGLLDLYQQKYPQVDEDIAAEIEAIELDYVREDLPKLISSMQVGVNRIRDISTSLRTFSRADSDRPVACNLHEGIDSTVLMLKHRLKATSDRPEIQVVKQYGELPLVECFAGQLNQVFMNLLANAIDALEESNQNRSFNEIQANPNCITIQTSIEGEQVAIRIQDNGIGMSQAVQQKIFEHTFTTKAVGKGTGLGLAIARQIVVDRHGGSLDMQSELGQGTEFVIRIPMLH